jgi:hypothetical protein
MSTRLRRAGALTGLAIAVCSCGPSALRQYIPQAIDFREYIPRPINQLPRAADYCRQKPLVDATQTETLLALSRVPPRLASTRVIDTISKTATLYSAVAAQTANYMALSESDLVGVAAAAAMTERGQRYLSDQAVLQSLPQPSLLTAQDFWDFTDTFSEFVLRGTGKSLDSPATSDQLQAYYQTFYKGEFIDYFGNPLPKPSVSMTITNAELANSLVVFVDFLFDARGTPVWKSGSGKDTVYYPGGVKKRPSVLDIQKREALDFPKPCAMTVEKAVQMNYLARTFASAASTQSSLITNSFGGIEVGFGVLGKLNIGDNQTLLAVIRAVITQVVARTTVELTYPILSQIPVSPAPNVLTSSARGRAYSSLFVSPNQVAIPAAR